MKNKNFGFTILESLVAITIVSLAISGAFSAVRLGLFSASMAKEETKAYYLAQEGVEIIRNKRDGNILDSLANGGLTSWLSGIADVASDPCFTGKTCYVDVYTNTIIACAGSWDSCPILRQNQVNYLYGYDGTWTQTIYKREIQIEKTSVTDVAVTVIVSWSHAGLARQFKAKTLLTNWF